jgi:RNA polymerase sigma-70 factor (ECF subfamily)
VQDTFEPPVLTLGDVLYAKGTGGLSVEDDWKGLVDAVAAGDQSAMIALYERANRAVFAFMGAMTGNRSVAEELTLETFCGVWHKASNYDAAETTVLGWLMRLARSEAMVRLRAEKQGKASGPLMGFKTPIPGDVAQFSDQGRLLRKALADLYAEEKQAIEAAVFSGLAYADIAKRLNQPVESIESAIRTGLHKLDRRVHGGTQGTSPREGQDACAHTDSMCIYAVQVLSQSRSLAMETHIAGCGQCEREFRKYRLMVASLGAWPSEALRPAASIGERLARRIAITAGSDPAAPAARQWREPDWEQVAPGISCRLMATDTDRNIVSMLVRLVPDGSYPAHQHAGSEELYLLDGELWIDDRKLFPGDYNRAEAGTGDVRVWSETGCTCVLITSTRDTLI